MRLRRAGTDDADVLAAAHARSFDASWSAPDIANLMSAMGGFAYLAEGDEGAVGFILGRAIGGEAEILTLVVAPDQRRSGVGHGLVEALVAEAAARGAGSVYLEVAADNEAAQALYRKAGFERAGFRRGYYARDGAKPVDALVLRRTLNSPPG
jgi:ribosomal-protein-alanine N-acetyltransferase